MLDRIGSLFGTRSLRPEISEDEASEISFGNEKVVKQDTKGKAKAGSKGKQNVEPKVKAASKVEEVEDEEDDEEDEETEPDVLVAIPLVARS